MRDDGIVGEVIVADNGSKDASRELAAEAGARVRSGDGSRAMATRSWAASLRRAVGSCSWVMPTTATIF